MSLALFTAFISCKERSSETQIIGKWQVDSVNKYDDGEEIMLRLRENDNLFLGSVSNPSMVNFTNQHEVFFYKKDGTNKRFSTYSIVNDTLDCKSLGVYKIKNITDKTVILEIETKMIYFDGKEEHPKQILTYYLTKVKS